MKFQWDPNKAAINLRKHGIGFEEALTVFQDPLALIFDDEEHSRDEHREIIIGFSTLSKLLLVCFVERQENVIRIISARQATRLEKQDYEEHLRSQKK
ncbi:MAG: BrnT family toxin [Chloroflexi bacterium]|nr:BrnT family toxin [Chloroflexota bacterium]